MAKRGAKTLYTDEMHKQIVDALETGVKIEDACALVGINKTTYFRWVEKYANFATDTACARVQGRIGAAAVVRRAALGGDVSAAEWYLERTDPQTWGRTTKVILDVPPETQKRLQAWAQQSGVDLAAVFEAMINESVITDPTAESEE